jgi:hypothetical protein
VLASDVDNIYPISSIVLTCSLVDNNLRVPAASIYTFDIAGTPFGSLVSERLGAYAFVPIKDGIYPEMTIRFYDQDGNRIYFRDTDVLVYLVVKGPDE